MTSSVNLLSSLFVENSINFTKKSAKGTSREGIFSFTLSKVKGQIFGLAAGVDEPCPYNSVGPINQATTSIIFHVGAGRVCDRLNKDGRRQSDHWILPLAEAPLQSRRAWH